MVDLLRRSLAPLAEIAWKEVDDAAARVLKSHLTARGLVDFDGPHGWDLAAVNLGRLEIPKRSAPDEVPWGKRLVLPLVETRLPLRVPQMTLDEIARGAKDADLTAVEDAARRVAIFEESAVYNGFEPGGIKGIIPESEHPAVGLPKNMQEFPGIVAMAVRTLTLAGVEGPFALVLGSEPWTALMRHVGGYPPHRIIQRMLGGEIRMSPAIDGGVLLSTAKGNFELTVGQDFSIGYLAHDATSVDLYVTESFTFHVLQRQAAVPFGP